MAFLERVRAENRMARHNVYAYILRADGRIRYSDDGEPQKTAGMPTLEAIQHAGLTDVIVVVTRYFGGILLGTGGLVRAYTQATQAGLAAAEKVTVSRCVDVTVHVEYALYERTLRCAEECGAKVADSVFTDEVTLSPAHARRYAGRTFEENDGTVPRERAHRGQQVPTMHRSSERARPPKNVRLLVVFP